MCVDPFRLRILTFHGAESDVDDPLAIAPQKLADFLQIVRDEGYLTLRASDLVGAWQGAAEGGRAVVLTFDDGYAAHRDVVGERLAELGLVGTFFVITSVLHEKRSVQELSATRRVFMSTGDVRALVAAGMEVGSHSHSHALMGVLSARRAREEARLSKEILEQCLGRSVTTFAYPFGRQRAYSSLTRAVLEESGYLAAFTQMGTPIGSRTDRLALPRISIDATDTVSTFVGKLRGQYEPMAKVWAYVRRG